MAKEMGRAGRGPAAALLMASRSLGRNVPQGLSPFTLPDKRPLAPAKFIDPLVTADGSPRAVIALERLETLWLNTGTLCNLACAGCYIESSPTNDALVYLTLAEAERFLDELNLPTEIGLTGGEPFMNPGIIPILEAALGRGHRVLLLTNAMRPMRRHEAALLSLRQRFGAAFTLRVSIDHYNPAVHEGERGPGSWRPMIDGLQWLSANGFAIAAAGRALSGEDAVIARAAYGALFAAEDIAIDATDPAQLIIFPEMDESADVPEITEACWDILHKRPADVMCATSRMVVHRRGEERARVVACTLLPYDARFDLGETLAEAARSVALNHPHCSRFCVLGGASCSA
jgi:hypothetical protein